MKLTKFAMFTGLALAALVQAAYAQPYPSKAVTFVVPYPAGGRTDLTARVVAQYLKTELGQPVVVVNKPGASGVFAPKGTPAAAIVTLNSALEKVARDTQFIEQMGALLLGVRHMNQQEFTRFFQEQDALFKPLIDKLGLAVVPKS